MVSDFEMIVLCAGAVCCAGAAHAARASVSATVAEQPRNIVSSVTRLDSAMIGVVLTRRIVAEFKLRDAAGVRPSEPGKWHADTDLTL